MKKVIYLFVFLSLVGYAYGQQDPQYSQYMFNQLAFNPAYAGSRGTLSGTVLLRKQWWGFPGAPTNANVSVHSPSANERNSFGLNFNHDELGLISQNFLEISYAYRIQLKKGALALGLQGGFTHFKNRFSAYDTRDFDPAAPTSDLSAWLPRFGTGAYYHTERFFAGLSAPNLLAGGYYRFKKLPTTIADHQRIHYFAMLGGIMPIGKSVDVRPSAIFKYVHNAPSSVDLNLTFFFSEVFGLGAGYRTGDGLIFMLEYISPKSFRLGYAFDYSLNEIMSVSAGSHEFMVGFDLNWGRSRFLTPRYF